MEQTQPSIHHTGKHWLCYIWRYPQFIHACSHLYIPYVAITRWLLNVCSSQCLGKNPSVNLVKIRVSIKLLSSREDPQNTFHEWRSPPHCKWCVGCLISITYHGCNQSVLPCVPLYLNSRYFSLAHTAEDVIQCSFITTPPGAQLPEPPLRPGCLETSESSRTPKGLFQTLGSSCDFLQRSVIHAQNYSDFHTQSLNCKQWTMLTSKRLLWRHSCSSKAFGSWYEAVLAWTQSKQLQGTLH